MENKEPHEILIVDDNENFRESAALALHRAFGVIAMEGNLDKETLAQINWRKVRTVVTDGGREDYKRLHFLLSVIRQHPQISLMALKVEQHQVEMQDILAKVCAK